MQGCCGRRESCRPNDRWIASSSEMWFSKKKRLNSWSSRDASVHQPDGSTSWQLPFFSEPHNSNACFLTGNSKTRSHDVLTLVPRCPPNPHNLTKPYNDAPPFDTHPGSSTTTHRGTDIELADALSDTTIDPNVQEDDAQGSTATQIFYSPVPLST